LGSEAKRVKVPLYLLSIWLAAILVNTPATSVGRFFIGDTMLEGLDTLFGDAIETPTEPNLTIDSTIDLTANGSTTANYYSGGSGTWTTTTPMPYTSLILNWPTPDANRRQRRARRREREPEQPRRPLSRLSDEDYLELSARLHQQYEDNLIENERIARIYHDEDARDRRRHNREFWTMHRRDNPDCDCERCRTYRGMTGEHDEDSLGW
jgi:hypothetical protein